MNFRNFLTFPVTLEGDGQTWKRARIEKCGQGGHAGPFKAPTSALTGLPVGGVIGQTVEDITLSEIGNDGYDVFQHAFDVSYSHFSRIQDISMEAQGGDSGGYSTIASGLTAIDCIGTTFTGILHSGFTATTIDHLPVSLLGLDSCIVNDINLRGHKTYGLEVNSCSRTTISGGVVDGGYLADGGYQPGVYFDVGSQYPEFNRSRRISRNACNDVILADFVITRTSHGVWSAAEGVKMVNVRVAGATTDGFLFTSQTAPSGGTISQAARMVEIIGCSAENCGRAGLYAEYLDALTINGFKGRNNGQDSALTAITRSGIYIKPLLSARRVALQGYETLDDQGVTYTAGITFEPGAADADFRKWVTCKDPDRVSIGQYITVEGGLGSGSDATGKIVDQRLDEIQLEFSGATTLSSTGNTTALTGTWTTNGTDTTRIDGSGTNATVDLVGNWITNGSAWRQVLKVVSTTQILVSSAFPTALSGATLSSLLCDLTTIVSQQYGAYVDPNSYLSALFIAPNGYSKGNAVAQTFLNDFSVLEPGSMFYADANGWGVEYHETALAMPDLIIDDTVANAPNAVWRTNKSRRYQLGLSGTAESGGNAGSHVDEYVYADDGTTSTRVSRVTRATGIKNFYKVPQIAGLSMERLVAMSAVAVSVSGGSTSEEVLYTYTGTAGDIGANGMLLVRTGWSYTNSANNKTCRVKIGASGAGTGGTAMMAVTNTTTATFVRDTLIFNANNQAVQKAAPAANSTGLGASSAAMASATIDTSAAWEIAITGQKASGGETLTLEWVLIQILPQA